MFAVIWFLLVDLRFSQWGLWSMPLSRMSCSLMEACQHFIGSESRNQWEGGSKQNSAHSLLPMLGLLFDPADGGNMLVHLCQTTLCYTPAHSTGYYSLSYRRKCLLLCYIERFAFKISRIAQWRCCVVTTICLLQWRVTSLFRALNQCFGGQRFSIDLCVWKQNEHDTDFWHKYIGILFMWKLKEA